MSEALNFHKKLKGKIEIISRVPITTREDLSLAYTPGVADACRAIVADPSQVYELTRKHNMVAVVTDGSAVLGLGNIGPAASLPVMEGKAILFKTFADVDAFPIALDTQDVEEIIETVIRIAPMFGGINLEDISAPRCFEIEERLQKALHIPVFHDDQHGTAIVVLAGLYNALTVVNKKIGDITVTMSGVGAAGVAITKLLLLAGVKDVFLVDSKGLVYEGREDLNDVKIALATQTNKEKRMGTLADALKGADVFVSSLWHLMPSSLLWQIQIQKFFLTLQKKPELLWLQQAEVIFQIRSTMCLLFRVSFVGFSMHVSQMSRTR
ncbi:MAG: Malate dehydrogenase [Candidatus Magasanikbacteria bacterium GW2011_GWC2_42_27]|nr:MAG: Malate dehydrogenase [Candidatus Magasanikbacteria bacterium GW2011_GWC2_42_27]